MSYSETLKTSEDGQYRVRLITDECADEPYDDGQSPLLWLDLFRGIAAQHIMATGRPTGDDERIEEAARRWGSPSGNDFRYFEKYLRAYYGTREIKTWYSGNYWYITYDTAEWRKYIGFEPDAETPHPLVNMDEYKAYCEGDVWGYDVERNVTWHRDDDPDKTMQTWESEDSCWGFYGYKYAKESALEAYQSVINKAHQEATAFRAL